MAHLDRFEQFFLCVDRIRAFGPLFEHVAYERQVVVVVGGYGSRGRTQDGSSVLTTLSIVGTAV